jgi:ATP-dependent phosphoenolpyruvate carboxykinase
MPIKATRALLNAALDGSLKNAEFRKDPNFGFDVPVACRASTTPSSTRAAPGPTLQRKRRRSE